MSPEQQALYTAVVASPDDDLPRLVYADWLEEHGQPDRAEFIRVQCRLANASPADADYFDLREREIELNAILGDQLEKERPKLPAGFDWEGEERGFLYRVTYNGAPQPLDWVEKHIEQLAALAPIRGIWTASGLAENLSEFVQRPSFERFEHLFVDSDDDLDLDDLVRAFAESQHLNRLCDLQFPFIEFSDKPFAAFAAAKSLRGLTRLDAGWGDLTRRSNAALRSATWRESIAELQLFGGNKFATVAARVAFPRLHSLCLFNSDLTPALADCLNDRVNFPSLAEVTLFGDSYDSPKGPAAFKPLDRPLAALRLEHVHLGRHGVRRLLDTPTGAGLRLLHLDRPHAAYWPGDLARATLPELRVLVLNVADLTGGMLAALGRATFWQTITEFSLVAVGSVARANDWAEFFRSLHAPHLRRLHIRCGKLQTRGIEGLLANSTFSGLRTLQLPDCGLGEKAARSLLVAPHLQNVTVLDLSDNHLGAAGEVLADPAVIPFARSIRLGKITLTPTVKRKLRQRQGLKFETK